MKKIAIIIGQIAITQISVNAQIIKDTVSIGAGYANENWYSLQNDEQGNAPKNEWDIAFSTSSAGAGIQINSVIGTKLWVYPNGDTAAWASIDTTGINSWTPRYNSDTSWSEGAFNIGVSSPYDLGWGIYNPITHEVIGDSIYILKLSNNSYKKIWIKKLSAGTYYFQYADLNGSNLVTTSVSKSPYSSKNFVYYSIQNNIIIDREPQSSNWDLLFKQYTAFIPSPYSVTGVLQNKGVTAVKVYPVDTSYNQWYNHTFQTAINTIGYNWKQYTGSWQIEDSLVYFVKSKQGDIWKIVFTGFGGVSNGNFIFQKQKISPTSISEVYDTKLDMIIYPNPIHNNEELYLLFDNKTLLNKVISIKITNSVGVCIQQKTVSINNSLSPVIIDTSMFPYGLYFITVQSDTIQYTSKFIKTN